MAVVVSHSEADGISADELWRLVVEVQRATLGLSDDSPTGHFELNSILVEHPLFATLIRTQHDNPATVVLRPQETSTTSIELLRRLLLAIDDGHESVGVAYRRSREAMNCLRESIHEFIQRSIQVECKRQSIEQAVQRSMYQFAYGLSHEINNPLANISARAAQLASRASDARDKKSLTTIVEQAMKAHEMLAEMMLAVQLPRLQCQPGDLRAFMKELSTHWRIEVLDRGINWQEAISDDFLWANFDSIAMNEAISAAIRNGLDACHSGDTIKLIAERTESPVGELEIRIAIVDNGPGLSQQNLDRAWDLYFSGREAGRGLGIGLAKVRRVIESHAGRIWLVSRPKQGCSVEIRLPWQKIANGNSFQLLLPTLP